MLTTHKSILLTTQKTTTHRKLQDASVSEEKMYHGAFLFFDALAEICSSDGCLLRLLRFALTCVVSGGEEVSVSLTFFFKQERGLGPLAFFLRKMERSRDGNISGRCFRASVFNSHFAMPCAFISVVSADLLDASEGVSTNNPLCVRNKQGTPGIPFRTSRNFGSCVAIHLMRRHITYWCVDVTRLTSDRDSHFQHSE